MDNYSLARPYAKAAFEFASSKNIAESWLQNILILANAMKVPDVVSYITSPKLDRKQKVMYLHTLVGNCIAGKLLQDGGSNKRSKSKQVTKLDDKTSKEVDKNFVSLLSLMAQHNRLTVFTEMFELFRKYKADADKILLVEVVTAFKLSEDEMKILYSKLAERFNCGIAIKEIVDNALIGGVIINTDREVIDGSVRSRLNKLAHTLVA